MTQPKKKKKLTEAQKARQERYKAGGRKQVWISCELDNILLSGVYGGNRIEASKELARRLDNKELRDIFDPEIILTGEAK